MGVVVRQWTNGDGAPEPCATCGQRDHLYRGAGATVCRRCERKRVPLERLAALVHQHWHEATQRWGLFTLALVSGCLCLSCAAVKRARKLPLTWTAAAALLVALSWGGPLAADPAVSPVGPPPEAVVSVDPGASQPAPEPTAPPSPPAPDPTPTPDWRKPLRAHVQEYRRLIEQAEVQIAQLSAQIDQASTALASAREQRRELIGARAAVERALQAETP